MEETQLLGHHLLAHIPPPRLWTNLQEVATELNGTAPSASYQKKIALQLPSLS